MKKPEITLPEEQTPRAPRVLDPQQGGWGAEVGKTANSSSWNAQERQGIVLLVLAYVTDQRNPFLCKDPPAQGVK